MNLESGIWRGKKIIIHNWIYDRRIAHCKYAKHKGITQKFIYNESS